MVTTPTVLDGLRVLARHGGVVEVRMLKTSKATVSGYFDNMEALVTAITPWDGKTNIYVTANPVHPDLLARATNRLKAFATETTADKDILRRAWFLTDFDPVRPKGISSTTEQVAAALARRDEAVAFLRELGFQDPIEAMSGNGAHACYAVDLPNDEATRLLFERALKALQARFDDAAVHVDESVFNAARIWKLYGTTACKGDATADRPHRRAELERVPAELIPVDIEMLTALARMAPAPQRTVNMPAGRGSLPPLDLVGAFQARGWYARALHGGKHAVTCPWASAHSGDSGPTETCLFDPRADGEPWGFDCKHSHCSDRTIKDVLTVLGLGMNGHAGASAVVEPHAGPTPEPPYAFMPAVSRGHFLADYIAYAAERTDAAHEFHEGTGLMLLAAATPGVKTRLRQYPHGLATNLYMLFVGGSTSSRKSTAKDLGRDLHDAVVADAALADLTSPEGFIEQLARRSGQASTWFVDEMGDLLDKLHHAKFMAGLRGCLLQVYDGRDYKYSRHSKRAKTGAAIEDVDWVRTPHLNVLGAATETLFDTLTSADLTSGLLMRFALVMPARKPPRRGFDEAPAALTDRRNALTARLHRLFAWSLSADRPVVFAPGALQHLDAFAADMERTSAELEERQRAMLRRLDAMVLKLGMLVAAGRPDTPDGDGLTVTRDDAEQAITIARRWRQDAIAFASRIGETEFERHVSRCLKVVSAKGRAPRRLVAQHVHLNKRVLDDIEATLQDRGLIRLDRVQAKGRPAFTTWQYTGGESA